MVKLVQILKLKKNCGKLVADFFLELLNKEGSINESPEVTQFKLFDNYLMLGGRFLYMVPWVTCSQKCRVE